MLRVSASWPPWKNYEDRTRLECRDDGRDLHRGNFHPSIGRDHRLCRHVEFLALPAPHTALRLECRIRCHGATSTTVRSELGWIRKGVEARAPPDVVVVGQGPPGSDEAL